MTKKGLLIVISGASGTGKGTVCQKLLQEVPKLNYSISATSRTPRPNEIDGKEYYFLSTEEFKKWIQAGRFLEFAEIYGNLYGTPLNKIEEDLSNGKDILLEIDVQGALNVKKKYPEGICISLLPPSLEELEKRIIGRGSENTESLSKRLQSAVSEIKCGLNYDYVVVNNSIEEVVTQIKSIIVAEHSKVKRNLEKFNLKEIELK